MELKTKAWRILKHTSLPSFFKIICNNPCPWNQTARDKTTKHRFFLSSLECTESTWISFLTSSLSLTISPRWDPKHPLHSPFVLKLGREHSLHQNLTTARTLRLAGTADCFLIGATNFPCPRAWIRYASNTSFPRVTEHQRCSVEDPWQKCCNLPSDTSRQNILELSHFISIFRKTQFSILFLKTWFIKLILKDYTQRVILLMDRNCQDHIWRVTFSMLYEYDPQITRVVSKILINVEQCNHNIYFKVDLQFIGVYC